MTTERPRTEPGTPSTAVPPTESFRHPDAIAPTVPMTDPRRSREPVQVQLGPGPSERERSAAEAEGVASRDTDPSPPPSRGREAQPTPAPAALDTRALASVTTKSPATSLEDETEVGSTPSRRAGYVMSSQRISHNEYRLDELEEQLRALDARLRLAHKAQQRQARGLVLVALFSVAAWLLSRAL